MRLLIGVLASAFVLNPVAATAITPAAGAEPPKQEFVTNEARTVRCIIEAEHVGCQTAGPVGFTNTPYEDRVHINNVSIMSYDVGLNFSASNMQSTGYASPKNDRVLIPGQVLQINGWIVEPDANGTRISDGPDGHGMYVTVDRVTAY